jgi:hypothetical protein
MFCFGERDEEGNAKPMCSAAWYEVSAPRTYKGIRTVFFD